ncbi:hypothetical protein H8S23_02270 [Anaerofilum sp. BX8]|uniref:Membrane protein 6-pyruvoyl-tetrahydropterin synthase-related domain-containing protein n=1 Tax=Anaerofilum hominis TaxID=2763016 RepID=A0A923IDG8_9FIRM|nr:hypothetical protein [Anaerofilum hominis]MBC5580322.1 hypothetical protein [Anaerofilum hominis]
MMKENTKRGLTAALLLTAVLICSVSLFWPGVPFGHDFSFHLSRINSICEGMRHGHFFLKVYPDLYNGYGYACGLFYGDFFLNIPAFLTLCGVDLITSYKIFLVLIIAGTAGSAYYASSRIFRSRLAGLISALLYVFSSYFIFDLYLRADLGEVQAWIFFPLILLGIYRLLFGEYQKSLPLIVGFAGLLLSHLLSFAMALAFAALFFLIGLFRFLAEPKRFIALLKATGITLLVTAFFLFPLLEQMLTGRIYSHQVNEVLILSESAVRIRNLFYNFSGSPIMSPGVVFPGIGLLFPLVYLGRPFIARKREMSVHFCDFCLVMGSLALFASTSVFPWAFLSRYLYFLQFPWRLFLPACAFLSIAGGYVFSQLARRSPKLVFPLLCFCLVGASMVTLKEQRTIYLASAAQPSPESNYQTARTVEEGGMLYFSIEQCKFIDNNYFHENHQGEFFSPPPDAELMGQAPVPCSIRREYGKIYLAYDNPNKDAAAVTLPLNYTKGYSAIDLTTGGECALTPGNNGFAELSLPARSSEEILIRYSGTSLQHFTAGLSILTLFIFPVYLLGIRRKKLF